MENFPNLKQFRDYPIGIYEAFAIVIPGAMAMVLFVGFMGGTSIPLRMPISVGDWLFNAMASYVTGLMIQGASSIALSIPQLIRARFERNQLAGSDTFDDRAVFELARANAAEYFGATEEDLTVADVFRLCYSAAYERMGSYRMFSALADMCRGLALLAALSGLMFLSKAVRGGMLIHLPSSSGPATFLTEMDCSSAALASLVAMACFINRHRRFAYVCRRIVYPLLWPSYAMR